MIIAKLHGLIVECDSCKSNDFVADARSESEARIRLRAAGWSRAPALDRCPKCSNDDAPDLADAPGVSAIQRAACESTADSYGSDSRMPRTAPATCIVSTRSNASEDARRDFDHFDEDEELSRLREAMRQGQWRVATELASNLDEYLSRGGSLPAAWLGPTCMQEPGNLNAHREDSLESAPRMSQQQRQTANPGHVEVLPEPPPRRLIADRLSRQHRMRNRGRDE